jgi:hypothetical protein
VLGAAPFAVPLAACFTSVPFFQAPNTNAQARILNARRVGGGFRHDVRGGRT